MVPRPTVRVGGAPSTRRVFVEWPLKAAPVGYVQPMSDSRSDDSYGWLYGDGRTGASQPSAPPPRTGSDLPPPNLPPPGEGGRHAGGDEPPRRRKRKKRPLRWVLAFFVAWLLFLVIVPLWSWSDITRVDAEPDGDRPGDHGGTTYLMIGTDSRSDLSEEEQERLATGNPDVNLADTIMIMHVGSGPTTLVSLPRDSLVEIPGHGVAKINGAYSRGGPELMVATVENATGLRMDNYVEVGLGGFADMVDAVGGVEICPDRPHDDPKAGLDIEAGCQEADGAVALGYARTRAGSSGDIERVERQREVLGAVGSEARSPWTIINPVRYYRVNRAAANVLAIGENVNQIDLARFGWNLSGAMSGDGLSCTVPLASMEVRWNEERATEFFNHLREDRTDELGDLCSASGGLLDD